MQWKQQLGGLLFCGLFVLCYFTNKFVLSVLKFTFPTLFQGWQTLTGFLLLLVSVKLGLVEMSRLNRSSVLSWFPGSLLFLGNIYAGSRALAQIDIPFFFTLQNSSHVVTSIVQKLLHRERPKWLKLISLCLMFISAVNLPYCDPQFELTVYLWAGLHLLCVGLYRVFQLHHKSSNLSDIEQQCINYVCSVLLLAVAAHPTGDLMAAMAFPSLHSHTFHGGCCASALFGFLLLLATVKLKSGLSVEQLKLWMFVAKVSAVSLSPFMFNMDVNANALTCVVVSHMAEVLLVLSEIQPQL